MKRAEIEEQIALILNKSCTPSGFVMKSIATIDLTDLFIQLSEERLKEQKAICSNELLESRGTVSDENKAILNAPFPTLD